MFRWMHKIVLTEPKEDLGYYCCICNKILHYSTAKQLEYHNSSETHEQKCEKHFFDELNVKKLEKKLQQLQKKYSNKNLMSYQMDK